jgi:hypothetical protein
VGDVERGGVLLRFAAGEDGAALAFIPAGVARRLAALTALTPVPGVPPPAVGIALAEGAVVTVLSLGGGPASSAPGHEPDDEWPVPGSDRAVLCDLGGLGVAITGGTVLATGVFDAVPDEDGVLWRGEPVPVLDVRALYAQAEAAIWAERAVSGPPQRRRTGAPSSRASGDPTPTPPQGGARNGGEQSAEGAPRAEGSLGSLVRADLEDEDGGRAALLPGERGEPGDTTGGSR